MKRKKPQKIENVLDVIKECIEKDRYTLTVHALERQKERKIDISEITHVLKMGYEENETFIYEGLGFPIRLVNVPLRKVYGEWAFDFSMGIFQKVVLNMLATKLSPITGSQLRFIINYFEMSYREFAKIFGVSHVTVVKWEKEESRMNPTSEIYLRLYILKYLKVSDKEFRKLYDKINLENLVHAECEKDPLEIDADEIAC